MSTSLRDLAKPDEELARHVTPPIPNLKDVERTKNVQLFHSTSMRTVTRSVACILFVCILTISLRNVSFHFDNTSSLLGTHHYGADGLLVVNPNGPHPIFELIQQAEEDWARKHDRASKSLSEAVAEYKRRYHRHPPLHFEKWWDYVVEHDVQLPDEYDEIYRDLEPFWGIDPLDFQKTREELETQNFTVVVEKTDQSPRIEVVNRNLPPNKVEHLTGTIRNILVLLEDIEHSLLPFRAVFSPNDGPSMLSDYGLKSMALAAAANGSTLKRSELPTVQRSGWLSACHPSSPAWQYPLDLDNPPEPPSHKTFISDHRLSMDPCLNPSLLYNHGEFVRFPGGPGPQKTLIPRFSISSTILHHDIRPANPYHWIEDILPSSDNPPFEERVDERLVWRGSNTGMRHAVDTRWRNSQRDRLIFHVNDLAGTVDVLRSPQDDSERVGEPVPLRKAHANPALFDIQFAGKPIHCDPESFCKYINELFDWRKIQNSSDAGRYKYVLDIDGNGWSGRFKRLITAKSLVFKATAYPEWFMDRVAPWVHYVPVQMDLSDLYDTLIFFRGGLHGEGAHEDLARKIATAGREWSKNFWRREDMTAYMFRLFLEYARVSSLDRDAMTYKGTDS